MNPADRQYINLNNLNLAPNSVSQSTLNTARNLSNNKVSASDTAVLENIGS